jgi:hypothetical protein
MIIATRDKTPRHGLQVTTDVHAPPAMNANSPFQNGNQTPPMKPQAK